MTEDERRRLIDDEHLRLLRLGFFIAAAANTIWIGVGLIYVLIGLAFAVTSGQGANAPPPEFRSIVMIVGCAVAGLAGVLTTLKLMVARRIRERRSRVFCMIVSGISCAAVPYGTALGVLALLVLNRQSVAQQFQPA
ncbi:MAG TPA: hypothetical protein VL284_10370 [Thermoanaerobaculia bacterium]|nr:hypothetical protein [Thermoanaerobaculia bacterium]